MRIITVDLIRGVDWSAIVNAIATEVAWDAKIGFFASELLAVRRVLDLCPNSLEAFGTDGLVGHKKTKNDAVNCRSWALCSDNTYDILMRLFSEIISEFCSKLSPQSSSGVLLFSFQGQTLKVAAGHPRSAKKVRLIIYVVLQIDIYNHWAFPQPRTFQSRAWFCVLDWRWWTNCTE